MNYKPELLAPAGSKDVLDAAIGEGADSVYLALKDFNARARAKNFNYKEFEACVDKLHAAGKKVYVAVNTLFEEWERDKIYNYIKYLSLVKPDALIVADLGIIYMINKYFPELRIHASTQMNVSSAKGVNFLSKNGVKRVVLGRELTFQEIKNIKESSGLELEVFVHGALCFSTSGLCFFSSFLDAKSGNRGYCAQPCRRLYKNDKKSGFFFSPADLQLIEHIPDLAEIGVNSFKIEGRMKSALYVANVVRAYRHVIDNYAADRESAIHHAKEILSFDMARNKSIFHFRSKDDFSFVNPDEKNEAGLLLGNILKIKNIDGKKAAYINTDFELNNGDQLRITSSKDKMKKNIKADIIGNDEKTFQIALPNGFEINDKVYLVSANALKKKYHMIIPKNLSKYKRHPGNKPAPLLKTEHSNKQLYFPEGYYLKLDDTENYFTAQTFSPVMLILKLNEKVFKNLTSAKSPIPLKKENIIIELPPLFYNSDELPFDESINKLLDAGYKKFVINNLGHINIFKNKNITLIAGEFLYALNSYAIKFLMDAGVNCFITSLENNKRNLFVETSYFNRKNFFITVYAYLELFNVRGNLSKKYNFNCFKDKHDNSYKIKSNENESIVFSEKPFSLTDKIDALRKNNFDKFIIDLSNNNISRTECKNIKDSLYKAIPLAKSTKFNWKSGFFKNDVKKDAKKSKEKE